MIMSMRTPYLAARGDATADMFVPQRVDKIFRNMDRNKDAKLTFEEFVEGSKQDPTYRSGELKITDQKNDVLRGSRLCLFTTTSYNLQTLVRFDLYPVLLV